MNREKRNLTATESRALLAFGKWLIALEEVSKVWNEAAIKLNPCELAYRVSLMNQYGDLINAEKSGPARAELLEEAMTVTKGALACHPEEVNSHYAVGIAAWMAVQLGLQQHLELDAALERDPLFIPLLEQRLAVARRRGPDSAKTWEARLSHARGLAPN